MVAISSSRGSSQPRAQRSNPHLLHWHADSLPLSHLGGPRKSFKRPISKSRHDEETRPSGLYLDLEERPVKEVIRVKCGHKGGA